MHKWDARELEKRARALFCTSGLKPRKGWASKSACINLYSPVTDDEAARPGQGLARGCKTGNE